MIDETVILLTPFEDCSKHRLSRHIGDYLQFTPIFNRYFYEPLQKLFSKVILYDYEKQMMEIGVKAVNKEIIDLVVRKHPQYALWVAWCPSYEIQESTFEIIRKEGTIVVGWFLDDEVHFDDYSKWWIPYLDYCVTNDSKAVPKYRALNAWAIQAIGTGTAVDRDWSNIEEKYEVSFVGYKDYARKQYINKLKKRGIPIHPFGKGWGGYVSFEAMIDIFKTSKINLNFSGIGYAPWIKQMKGRIFEVCLAGGFLLTEYVPGIENYFEIDKEIVCFEDTEEMIDKITYYLNHETERRAIAQAGWERATGEYTSFHILSKVFCEIEQDIAVKGERGNPCPQELRIPLLVRRNFSNYYLRWAVALLLENYKGLWKDTLALSLSYYPFNIRARCLYIVAFLPPFMRPVLSGLYSVKERLYRVQLPKLSSIAYLVKIKQSFNKRLFRT